MGQPFPWVGVGAPRSEQVQPQTPLVGSVPQTYGLGAKKKAPEAVAPQTDRLPVPAERDSTVLSLPRKRQ